MPMTAATLTPSATAADLREEIRQLLGRHDGAETLEELREFADELSGVLRRYRGRIGRLARQKRPAPEVEVEQPAPPVTEKPTAEARAIVPETEHPTAAWPRPTFAAPLPPPDPVVIEIRPDRPLPEPSAPPPAETPAAAPIRRDVPAVVGLVLTVLSVLWHALTGRPRRTVRRVAGAVRTAVRRAVAAAGPYARRFRAAARRELDRWLQ